MRPTPKGQGYEWTPLGPVPLGEGAQVAATYGVYGAMAAPVPDPDAGHQVAAIAHENRARRAIRDLLAFEGEGELSKVSRALAAHLPELLSAIADLADLPPDALKLISPDAMREWRSLVVRLRAALFDRSVAGRRRRDYLTNRVIRQAAARGGDTSPESVAHAVEMVIALTRLDHHAGPLAKRLEVDRAKLTECVHLAIARRPKGNAWRTSRRQADVAAARAYNTALRALLIAVDLPTTDERRDSEARSRIKRKSR